MDAYEARKMATSTNSIGVEDQLKEIRNTIRSTCERGRFSCTLFMQLLPGTIQVLIKEGFKVDQKTDNDKGMSLEYFEISW